MKKTYYAYDKAAKVILKNRGLLSYLAQQLLPEFKGMDRADIEKLIDGEMNSEPNDLGDRVIVNDLVIRFRLPEENDHFIGVILDIEPQGSPYNSYPLENRQWYYASRIFSRQDKDYRNLSKVYSIWINMECPRYLEDSITIDTIQRSVLIGSDEQCKPIISPIEVINVNTGTRHNYLNDPPSLLELFYLLFRSVEIDDASERVSIIKNKYSIKYSKREANTMLEFFSKDTSYLYRDGMTDGFAKGKAEGVAEGRAEGKIEGQVAAIINIISSGIPFLEACRMAKADDKVRRAVLEKIEKDQLDMR